MFLIASTGRCGTEGLCHGLDLATDHEVRHERPPQLLQEAFDKHTGRADHRSRRFRERLADYAGRAGEPYGESIRSPNLLDEIVEVVPDLHVVVLVREPVAYAKSAYAKGATRINGEWDDLRLLPLDRPRSASSAETLLWSWTVVNGYLLDFVEQDPDRRAVWLFQPWHHVIDDLAADLGVRIEDRSAMLELLRSGKNRSPSDVEPLAIVDGDVPDEATAMWDRARRLARRA